jgi:hypothetical protein
MGYAPDGKKRSERKGDEVVDQASAWLQSRA